MYSQKKNLKKQDSCHKKNKKKLGRGKTWPGQTDKVPDLSTRKTGKVSDRPTLQRGKGQGRTPYPFAK